MCVHNLKFIALPIPDIIGGTHKTWAVIGYSHAPFSPKFVMGFCSDGMRGRGAPCISVADEVVTRYCYNL